MPSKLVATGEVATQAFDWGAIKWLVAPENTPEAALSFGNVVLMPGKGHDRHNHPQSEEILYILSGRGKQMVDDGEPFDVVPGDTIYIPTAAFHSTINTGWEPLSILAIYNPAGPERDLRGLPDFREFGPGETVGLTVG
jgi:oxalate decarboxylase/phosphoglucose isomerase-like protein (cupin superfamily)